MAAHPFGRDVLSPCCSMALTSCWRACSLTRHLTRSPWSAACASCLTMATQGASSLVCWRRWLRCRGTSPTAGRSSLYLAGWLPNMCQNFQSEPCMAILSSVQQIASDSVAYAARTADALHQVLNVDPHAKVASSDTCLTLASCDCICSLDVPQRPLWAWPHSAVPIHVCNPVVPIQIPASCGSARWRQAAQGSSRVRGTGGYCRGRCAH